MTFLKEYRKTYQNGLYAFLEETHYVYLNKIAEGSNKCFELIDRLNEEFTAALKSQKRHPLAFEASVSVVFHKNRIFVKKFGFDGVYRPEFKHEKLLDFHYQNQTDPPDDIPYEDFEARGKVWDEILDNSETGSFAKVGMIYNFFNESDIWRLSSKLAIFYWKTKEVKI